VRRFLSNYFDLLLLLLRPCCPSGGPTGLSGPAALRPIRAASSIGPLGSQASARSVHDGDKQTNNTVNLCAIDLSKAFAKVNHHALLMTLMKRTYL